LDKNSKVCPAALAGLFNNFFRKIVQNPQEILKPYIKNGMTVLDFGCGPGFFTIEIAKMLSNSGRIIAVDLQEEMLKIIRQKIEKTNLKNIILLHKCKEDIIGLNEKVDFILLFWMFHEVPDQENTIKELMKLLRDNGKLLIAEPKIHVTEKRFKEMVRMIEKMKLVIEKGPKIFFSRSILLKK
jgi:ubiquinone/menaquinone biosynthesis C-methylase UbiE